MFIQKALPLLVLALAMAPAQAGSLIDKEEGGPGAICVDVDEIFGEFQDRRLSLTQQEEIGAAVVTELHRQLFGPGQANCPEFLSGDGNTIDISQIGGLPADLGAVDLVLRVGESCFPLQVAGNTVTLTDNFKCSDVFDALNLLVKDAKAKVCYNDSCPSDSRRRLLLEHGVAMQLEDARFQEHFIKCAAYDYDVSLVVEVRHIMAVASPQKNGLDAGCPLVVSHSNYIPHTGKHKKEALVWEDGKKREQALAQFNSDSHRIGTFKGLELIKAHESIDIDQVMQNKSYDVVSNNCATFLMALAKSLDVKVDAKMTAFVTRRLLQSSTQTFVDSIRNSVNFQSIFTDAGRGLRAQVSDEQVIEALVQNGAVAGGAVHA